MQFSAEYGVGRAPSTAAIAEVAPPVVVHHLTAKINESATEEEKGDPNELIFDWPTDRDLSDLM